MNYYICETCKHSTIDHEMTSPHLCLLCSCPGMKDGEPYVKPKAQPFEPSGLKKFPKT